MEMKRGEKAFILYSRSAARYKTGIMFNVNEIYSGVIKEKEAHSARYKNIWLI